MTTYLLWRSRAPRDGAEWLGPATATDWALAIVIDLILTSWLAAGVLLLVSL